MFGSIIGDMCGSTYEFENCKNIKKLEFLKKGSFPTDDSVMTVAVARALIDSEGMGDELVKEHLVNSMHYFGNLFPDAGYGGRFGKWIWHYDRRPYNSWGNGSGMRVSAAGWLYDDLDEVLHKAKLTAEVTHDHPEGIKGAQAIAACIFLARKGCSKEEIRDHVRNHFYKIDFTLDEIRPGYHFDVSCQGSCPQAIEAFLEGEGFEDTILKAISIGGDSDTIACMAGGIAEAFWGIPEDIEAQAFAILENCEGEYRRHNYSVLRDEILRFRRVLESKAAGTV